MYRSWIRWSVPAVFCVLLACPRASSAQATAATGPAIPPPDLKKWDVTAAFGWFNRSIDAGTAYGTSYAVHDSSLWTGVVFGHYWTEHLKTELEMASSGTGRGYTTQIYSDAALPPAAYPYSVYATRSVSGMQIAAIGAYQFFHNAWFHPSIAAGIVVERERTTIDRPAQTLYYGPYISGSPPPAVPVPAQSTTRRTWSTRPVAQAGFKAYLSQHAFFRSDLRLTLRDGICTTGRVGFGLDF